MARDLTGKNTVESYTSAVIAASAGATTDIVAAPGTGLQIWVYGFQGTAGTAAGTVRFIDSTPANLTGAMDVVVGGGFAVQPGTDWEKPLFKCATNTKLQMTTVTCTFNGVVQYATVAIVS